MIMRAYTTAQPPNLPSSPGQNLVAVIVGVFNTNSSFSLSKVAVVSIPYSQFKLKNSISAYSYIWSMA